MYHGEVNVAQESLNSFLAVAEDLQIKGLTQTDQNKDRSTSAICSSENTVPRVQDNGNSHNQPPPRLHQRATASTPATPVSLKSNNQHQMMTNMPSTQIKTEDPIVVGSEEVFDSINNSHQIAQLDEGDAELVDYDYDQNYAMEEVNYEAMGSQVYGGTGTGDFDFDQYVSQNISKLPGTKHIQCLLCSKITINIGNMKQHFEVHHYRRTYTCDVCNKMCKTKNCLFVHKKTYGHNTSTSAKD